MKPTQQEMISLIEDFARAFDTHGVFDPANAPMSMAQLARNAKDASARIAAANQFTRGLTEPLSGAIEEGVATGLALAAVKEVIAPGGSPLTIPAEFDLDDPQNVESFSRLKSLVMFAYLQGMGDKMPPAPPAQTAKVAASGSPGAFSSRAPVRQMAAAWESSQGQALEPGLVP